MLSPSGSAQAAIELSGSPGATDCLALRASAAAAVSWRALVAAAALSLSFVLGAAVFEGVAAGAGYSLRVDPLIQQGGGLTGTGETDLGNFGRGATPFTRIAKAETVEAYATSETSAYLVGYVGASGVWRLTECEFVYEAQPYYGRPGEWGSVPCKYLHEARSEEEGDWWEVAAEATELRPHTTYRVELYAADRYGGSSGGWLTFRTFGTLPAPAVVTGSASAITRTSATLNATVNPEGEEVTECYFEWWGPPTYESKVAACSSLPGSGETPVVVSAPLEGLSEASEYEFRVVATNAGGTRYGSEENFETRPYPPAVVTGSASAITRTSATLNATVNPEGEEVTECYFEWGATISYGNMAACSSLPGSGETPLVVSAPLESLSELSTYHFRVVATDARGTSYGSDDTFTTLPSPPAVVTGSGSAITRTSATLNATVNPEGEEVTECYFEWGATISYGNMAACSSLPGSGETPLVVSAPLESLSELSTYHFRVVATNARGTSYGSDDTFTTLPSPPVVVTGSASAITRSSATLNGTVNPSGGNVSSCEIEYATSPTLTSPTTVSCGSPGSGDSPVPVSASATGLAETTTYYFRVDATNAGGTSQGDIETFTTFTNQPTLTKIEPDAGLAEGGTYVKIKGMYLAGATEVKFGGTAVPASCSETECTTTSPAGAGTVSVTVTTAGGTSNAEQFIYVPVGPAPTVIALSVTSGPATGGTSVTITGTGFTGVTAVKFGPNEALIKSYSETSITVESSAGTGTVYVTVTTPNGTSPASGKAAKHAKFKYKKVKVKKVKK